MEQAFDIPESRAPRAIASGRFDGVSIALHWATALLIATQFVTAWLPHDGAHGAALLLVHRSSGVLVWIVAAGRLAWRQLFARLPPFPTHMPKIQQQLAKLNEYALYLLLLVQPVTGLSMVLSKGHPVTVLAWQIPALFAPDERMAHDFHRAHEIGASILLMLMTLHVTAALFHRLILRDEILARMLPRLPS